MTIDRRSLLKYAGLVPLMGVVPRLARAADEVTNEKADYTLRIGIGLVELAPNRVVSTTLYNGQFPGPLLRFKEGQRVVVIPTLRGCGRPDAAARCPRTPWS